MPIKIREPAAANLASSASEDSFEAWLSNVPLNRNEAWSLEAALTFAPGSGESLLKASRRIESLCRWAYIQMGRRQTSRRRSMGGLQVRPTGVRMAGAPAWDIKGRVACP